MKAKSPSLLYIVAFLFALLLLPARGDQSYTNNLPTGYSLIANQLDHGSNTLDDIFLNMPDGGSVTIYSRTVCDLANEYIYDSGFGGWVDGNFIPIDPASVTFGPGQAAFFFNPGPATTLVFTGTPHVPVLPATFPCGPGHSYVLGRQTNGPGTYENITGLAPQEGAMLMHWTGASFQTNLYSGGVWQPTNPAVNIGEGVIIYYPPLVAPAITTQPTPANLTVMQGEAATFTLTASGGAPLYYEWYHNNQRVLEALDDRLVISNTQPADAGGYFCVVTNASGSVTSAVVTLTVYQSYSIAITNGLNLIANQLDHGSNRLAQIFSWLDHGSNPPFVQIPAGTLVSKYNNDSNAWDQAIYLPGTGWVPSDFQLNPGEGAFLYSPTNFTLTFSGTPHVPVLPVHMPTGTVALVSRQTNDLGNPANILGTNPPTGGKAYKWDSATQSYQTFTKTGFGVGWTPSVPTAAVGEAMWIAPNGGGPSALPLFVQCAGDKLVQCGSTWDFDPPQAAGACSGNVTLTVLDTQTNGSSCPQTITRTWLVTGDCGNSNTCSQTVTLQDTTPPVIVCATNRVVSSFPGASAGGFELLTLRSFAVNGAEGIQPHSRVIEASDGLLYGTTAEGGMGNGGTIFKLNKDGSGFQVLRHLGTQGIDGVRPYAALVEGTDGALYGTTVAGGTNNAGTIFKLNKDGSGFGVLRAFLTNGIDGQVSYAGLVEGTDGVLYGTTVAGGASNAGTIFKLNKDGSGYQRIANLGSSGQDGVAPYAGLIEGTDGALYGTTVSGGTSNAGTIFKLNKDGSGYLTIANLGSSGQDGVQPAGIVEAIDGVLYGVTAAGGSNNAGTVFKLNKDGSGRLTIANIGSSGQDGVQPYGGLVEGLDGALYGTTLAGGSNNAGTVFKLNKDGSGYQRIANLGSSGQDGVQPAGIVEGADGVLYGATSAGGVNGTGTIFKLNEDGSGYLVIANIGSSGQDGVAPYAGLVEARDGWLYGTTPQGGLHNGGTIFRLNRDGTGFQVLRNLGTQGIDGVRPYAGLVEGRDGVMYGTTTAGGISNAGTIFKINKDGSGYLIISNLGTNGTDGVNPFGRLVEGRDGALYGTTIAGGASNAGTVFKLNKDGSGYQRIANLGSSGQDGVAPYSGLVEARDGVLYGTTAAGGASNAGTVFKLNKDGSGYLRIANLGSSGQDGVAPYGSLVEARDGVLYGTTAAGGTSNAGTIFKLNTNGSGYQRIANLGSSGQDGVQPYSGLVESRDGVMYGTTTAGGLYNGGTIFKLNPDGSGYVVVGNLGTQGTDGIVLRGPIIEASDGAMYGTTSAGGTNHTGTIFKLNLPDGSDFDLPVASDTCCGTNVAITVLNTTTNPAAPGAQTITRTWLATDCCSNTASCSQTLIVVDSRFPAITFQPQSLTTTQGADGLMVVTATGMLPLTYAWYHNNARILWAEDDRYVISNAQPADAGNYFCVVSNSFGSVTSAVATLSVISPTNCCDGCESPYPASYSVVVWPGFNFFANVLCRDTNILSALLTNAPDNATVYKWDEQTQDFDPNAASYFAGSSEWFPDLTLELGEGFALFNPGSPYTNTFFGCEPVCPLPCGPTSSACQVLGAPGLGTNTWTDLYSCPPACGTTLGIWNVANQDWDTYTYLNGSWLPSTPHWGVGLAVKVCVQTNTNCLPCANALSFTCPTNKTVECGSAWTFDSVLATNECCGTNITITIQGTVTNFSACLISYTRTWLITDCSTNSASCSQTVSVVDTTPPVFTNRPSPALDLGCNPANIPDCDAEVGARDDCGLPVPAYLLVSSSATHDVKRYNATTGAFVDSFASGGGLSYPSDLVFGPDGNLYVSSNGSDEVKRYHGTTGVFMDTFASGGGLDGPAGLTFGPDGNLYVSSQNTDQVKRYHGTTGAFIDNFASGGGLDSPWGCVFGPDGNFYVSSYVTHQVKRFNGATGAFLDNFVAFGSGGLHGPADLLFGPEGNLYIANYGGHEVNRYHGTTGAFIDSFVAYGSGGVSLPAGLAFGPGGDLYVSSINFFVSYDVKRYSGATGAYLGNFAVGGGLDDPMSVVFTPLTPQPQITCSKVDTTNGCVRTRTLTYTATDSCSNSSTCTQVVTWKEDTTPPVFAGCPSGPIPLPCNSAPSCATVAGLGITAADACSGSLTPVCTAGEIASVGCQRSQTFTLTATDACQNTANCQITFTWAVDTTMTPVFTGCPTGPISPPCNATPSCATVAGLGITATDGCSGDLTPVCTPGDVTSTGFERSQTFTLTATDACQNSATCQVTYNWMVDTTPPVLTSVPVGNNLGCNPTSLPTDASVLAQATATDDYAPPTIQVSHVDGGTTCARTRTFSITATDSCGNSSAPQLVAYTWTEDNTPPTLVRQPPAVSIRMKDDCLIRVPRIRVEASDNCTPRSQLVFTQNPVENAVVSGPSLDVLVTITDRCGNASTYPVKVYGNDRVTPTVEWVGLDPKSPEYTFTNCILPDLTSFVTATDNCDCPLTIEQIPPAGSIIAPPGYPRNIPKVAIKVTDCQGRVTTRFIRLAPSRSSNGMQAIPVWNTGVDENGDLLPPGTRDLHYELVDAPAGYLPWPETPVAVPDYSPWSPLGSAISGWIAPVTAPAWDSSACPEGIYHYRTAFVLPQFMDRRTAQVYGRWAVDNDAQLLVNGVLKETILDAANHVGWGSWDNFTLSGGRNHVPAPGDFLAYPAVNTIDFYVTNTSASYTGLRVELRGHGDCIDCSPPKITFITSGKGMKFGMSAYISVVVSGTGPLGFVWYHNNVEIPDQKNSPYRAVHTGRLGVEFTGSGLDQAGMYTVVVTNECGSATASTMLTVQSKNPRGGRTLLRLATASDEGEWAGWRFDSPEQPWAGNPGPALVVQGTNTLAIGFGSTEDFGVPPPAGQPASLLALPALPADTTIRLPAITDSNLTSYTLLLDLYSPSNSSGHVRTLFSNAGSTNGSFVWQVDAQNHLRLTGVVGGVPITAVSAATVLPETWHRLGLVVDITESEPSLQMYFDGQPDGLATPALSGELIPGLDLDLNSSNRTALILSSAAGDNAPLYIAGVFLQTAALAPQLMAAYGEPEVGQLIEIGPIADESPGISVTRAGACVNLSWTADQYVLQQTEDLHSDRWRDAVVPFTSESVSGTVRNTACVTPTPDVPQQFFRLTYRP